VTKVSVSAEGKPASLQPADRAIWRRPELKRLRAQDAALVNTTVADGIIHS